MSSIKDVQPLPYKTRHRTFLFLLSIFLCSLPFLFLYAAGYRFDFNKPSAIVGTGGIYVAAERTGAEIYIDNELVRETRVFRTAFYAQNLDPKTHRVHVQKEDHHTWVKELPVISHRVTEAQAFNMPLVPNIRVISAWTSATGSVVVRTPLPYASTTNEIIATTTKATSTLTRNPEYSALVINFASTTVVAKPTLVKKFEEEFTGTTTSTTDTPTSTREEGGVRLRVNSDGKLFAEWVGSFEQMPYYYCAEAFPRFSTTTESEENVATALKSVEEETEKLPPEGPVFIHPVQSVPPDTVCEQRIAIVNDLGEIRGYEFFPGSTDLIILEAAGGIYISEIDNRAWQNVQPLLEGKNLHVHVENGSIYVYDGTLIYQIMLEA